ncbi:hypothetical protein BT96DRAFT_1016429, partial [Gymnopus androsaceus JB14]
MFVILGAKSLFIFLLLRLLVVGTNFRASVNASAVLTATKPILNSLATLATIPTSCNDTCNAVEATISDCTTVECVCTSSNTASLDTCVNCLDAVEPNNQTNIAQAQDILGQYAALCDAGGISVPIQTASGFSGSVVLPTGSVSQIASTGTASSPITTSVSSTAATSSALSTSSVASSVSSSAAS